LKQPVTTYLEDDLKAFRTGNFNSKVSLTNHELQSSFGHILDSQAKQNCSV
jgi:hypothetical protein